MAKQPKARQWPHKIRPVKVSEMRVPTVGVSQRRFSRAQAEEYAADFDLNKFGTPTVNWRDGIYWIVDGQHRVAALKMWFAPSDPGDIVCNVYEGLSDAEMAELFRGLNTRRAVNSFDMFRVSVTAGRKRECDICRAIETQGLKVSQDQEDDCVSAVSSCGKVYDAAGDVVLGQSLRTLKTAFGGDPKAFDGKLIVGVGLVFNRYNGRTNEKEMIARLSTAPHGVHGLFRRAAAQRERTGNSLSQCLAATIVDVYNKGVHPKAKDRLPSWWKEAD